MEIVLFCENKYAIDILNPIQEHVTANKLPHEVLWYIHRKKIDSFAYADSVRWTNSMQEVYDFGPEAIFVPGNIVPYYLPGVKIQVFHGYAAEKKDHWIIRRYFDTYFTQGPYFTSHFKALAAQYGDFEVVETGWPKQDWIKQNLHRYDAEKQELLKKSGKKSIILYAPTFRKGQTLEPTELVEAFAFDAKEMLVIKRHPNQLLDLESIAPAITCGKVPTSTVLSVCDCVITDYSAITIEAALLGKPVYFYLFDYEDYMAHNGLNVKLFEEFPDCVFSDAQKLMDAVNSGEYDYKNYERFCNKYLPDLSGRATDKIAELIIDCMERDKYDAISESIARQNQADGAVGDKDTVCAQSL